MRAPCGIVLALTVTLTSHLLAQTAPESFDKPLRKTVIDLGRSAHAMPNDHEHVKLSCFYYPGFMVKEVIEPGIKGTALLTMAHTHLSEFPSCTRKQMPDDQSFKGWEGSFFAGVKHGLIFLYPEDGLNGYPIAAFDPKTGTKIFEDSIFPAKDWIKSLRFVPTSQSQVTVRYLRVFTGSCSIPKKGIACWKIFQQQTGLNTSPMPKCSNDFEGVDQGDTPSVIAYPVETTLLPKPVTKVLGNPVYCNAAE